MKDLPIITADHQQAIRSQTNPALPAIIQAAGLRACERFIEFLVARIRNRGTRAVYGRAIGRFCQWCEASQIELNQISPIVVAAYVEQLGHVLQKPTVKLHLSAIRMLFDDFVLGQVVPTNPAASVRGPKHVVKKGKTPVLTAQDTRLLLDSIDCSKIIGLRDRALISVMVYSFARVSATVGLNVGDFYQHGRRMWFRFHEKGGKHHEVPAHNTAEDYVSDYIQAAGIGSEKRGPLFRTVSRSRCFTLNRMHRNDVWRTIQGEPGWRGWRMPSAATPSEPRASRCTCRTMAPWNTPSKSPAMNRSERRSCTIEDPMLALVTKSIASLSDAGSYAPSTCDDGVLALTPVLG